MSVRDMRDLKEMSKSRMSLRSSGLRLLRWPFSVRNRSNETRKERSCCAYGVVPHNVDLIFQAVCCVNCTRTFWPIDHMADWIDDQLISSI